MRGLAISIRRFHDIAMTINAPTPWGDVNRQIDLVNILDEALGDYSDPGSRGIRPLGLKELCGTTGVEQGRAGG